MTIRGLADRRQAKLANVLRECENWSEQFGAWQSVNSLSRLEGLMELSRPYWRKIWTCDVLLQNLSREFSPPNRKNGACLWQQTCYRKQSQMKTLWGKSSRATRRGSTGMTRRRNASLRSGSRWFPEAKESAPGAVKSQSYAHCFLWYRGHCSLWVRSTRPKCKSTVLSTSFETSETRCFSQEATETGGRGLGATSRQCTSTHSTFHPGIFGKSLHSCRSATTLLPWHGSMWFLVVPPIKNSVEMDEIWRHWHKQNATSTLNTIPKDSLKKCFQQWRDRWKQCVSSQGEYFENY